MMFSLRQEMIERVRQIIHADRRRTIDEVSMLLGISHGNCHKILTEDGTCRIDVRSQIPECQSKTATT